MANYNKVILVGNLTRDPDLKYIPSGTAVCEFGLAVNRTYKSKDGNQSEEVSYFDVEAWGRQAEVVNQYLSKGRPILIEGRLKQNRWETQDGQKRSKIRVVLEQFQFLGGRGEGGGGRGEGGGGRGRQEAGPPADQGSPGEDPGQFPMDQDPSGDGDPPF
jgi:single-strand DNA-binding protein